ncbi:hypothetical protein K9N50_02635 [bacterium]|nr:hypothetical protein [bacterium]
MICKRLIRNYLALLFSFLSIGAVANAYELSNGELSLGLTLRSYYDSNVLNYSQRDRDRFLNDQEPYDSPITALDDLRSDFKVSIAYDKEYLSKRSTKITLTGDFAAFAVNPIKNFGWFSASVTQELSEQLKAYFNYFYDIDYYIRDYKDINSGNREHCNFSMDQWRGNLQYRPLKAFEFVVEGRFKKYAYNKYFTEYDSNYLEIGGEIIYRYRSWKFTIGYSLAENDNIGFNSLSSNSGEDDEDDEAGDGDYQQDTYSISLRYGFKTMDRRARFLLESSIIDRFYLTERSIQIDPMHSGRHDFMLNTDLSFMISFTKTVSFEIGTGYRNRRAESPALIVSKVKDYDSYMGWIEISYDLK